MSNAITIFAGTANPALATAISRELGVTIGACSIDRFPDGEIAIQLRESVRKKEVFLVQPTSPPVNDHLIELLALADACRRAAAERITAVVPYFGYGRADKRQGRSEPITGRMVADVLQTVGVAHLITVDAHTPQLEGFFAIPVDTLTAAPVLCGALHACLPSDIVVVAPDVGRMQMAADCARCLGLPVTVLHKQRNSGTNVKVTHVIGDVSNRACLIIDDMITTGATVSESVRALLAAGARPEFIVATTHGLFRAGARAKLEHPSVRAVYTTDAVPIAEKGWTKLHVVSIAPLIANALGELLAAASGANVGDIAQRQHGGPLTSRPLLR
jgi:ribose-phosphate pyrophosphokinase